MTDLGNLVRSLRSCGNWDGQVKIPGEEDSCRNCSYLDVENNVCLSWDWEAQKERILLDAADAIEELEYALLLMVLQYCTTDDGLLFHGFMSAGEIAFAVLGLENGQQEAPLWYKMDRMMQSASERAMAKTAPKEET